MSNNALPPSTAPYNRAERLNRLPVFYATQMVADADSFSPSASKPMAAVNSWLKLGITIDIFAPEPVTGNDLTRAHMPALVEDQCAEYRNETKWNA